MITLDFETYSEAGYVFKGDRYVPLVKGKPGLKALNASTYAAHPSTEVISMDYEGNLWVPWAAAPTPLFDHIAQGGLLEAHNSLFEWYIWNYVCVKRYGWPELPLEQMRCSASKARAYGLPGALGKVSEILTPTQQKDKRGKRLIQLLSIPKNPTAKDKSLRRTVDRYPELYWEMYQYNRQDVVAEKAVSAALPDLLPFELKLWQLDQRINARGVQVDVESLMACIKVFEAAQEKFTAELIEVTGGEVNTIDEIGKGSAGDKWLQSIGVNLLSLDKAHIAEAMEDPSLPPAARRAFEIRQLLGSSSVKKLYALERTTMADGRLRDSFVYCGADRTGRFAGRGVQPQNLKNSGPDSVRCVTCGAIRALDIMVCPDCNTPGGDHLEWGDETTEAALYYARLGCLNQYFTDPVVTVASCIRGLLVGDLICSDYSAIEAVVIAAVAKEEWRLEVFRTHGKIYEMSAAKISGIPFQEILNHKIETGQHHPLRKKIGKIAELGSAYGGWINAWKNFGAGSLMSDEEIKENILKWRADSPAIVELWGGQYRQDPSGSWDFTPELYGIEGAAIKAISYPGVPQLVQCLTYTYYDVQDVLACTLPSGRNLYYHKPRLSRGTDPRGLDVLEISCMGGAGWTRIHTYGSKMTENVIQAISRDILTAAMLRVEDAGYRIVLHVHDEIVAECPPGGNVEEFEKLMMVREPWFADWPIRAAGGWRGHRYRK